MFEMCQRHGLLQGPGAVPVIGSPGWFDAKGAVVKELCNKASWFNPGRDGFRAADGTTTAGEVGPSRQVIQYAGDMIDPDGYRPNVGIILSDGGGRVFWARRVGQNAWQFPQGGIRSDETPEEALYRELYEEVGLGPEHVEVVGATRGWLRYRLPKRFLRRNSRPLCIGQKQVWFILKFLGDESDVCLTRGDPPEFDHWRWVHYWQPVQEVVFFKRNVYRRALSELAPLIGPEPESSGRSNTERR